VYGPSNRKSYKTLEMAKGSSECRAITIHELEEKIPNIGIQKIFAPCFTLTEIHAPQIAHNGTATNAQKDGEVKYDFKVSVSLIEELFFHLQVLLLKIKSFLSTCLEVPEVLLFWEFLFYLCFPCFSGHQNK
jgi:hypothetical protein